MRFVFWDPFAVSTLTTDWAFGGRGRLRSRRLGTPWRFPACRGLGASAAKSDVVIKQRSNQCEIKNLLFPRLPGQKCKGKEKERRIAYGDLAREEDLAGIASYRSFTRYACRCLNALSQILTRQLASKIRAQESVSKKYQ